MGDSHGHAELSEADKEFLAKQREPHGQLRQGRVLVISQEAGSGYVTEEGTGHRYAFSRKWIPDAFVGLRKGTSVEFRLNRGNAVVELAVR